MPTARQPELSLQNPDRPPFITTTDFEEFCALRDRANRGELHVEWWETVPGHNAHWRCKVRYIGE